MSQSRRWMPDLAYAEAHRAALPEHYGRVGHRLDLADRDWTEFCHWCKEPVAIVEEVRDVGQNLREKATRVTRTLATRARVPAVMMAWRVERPADVQRRIDQLGRELLALQVQFPIVAFHARQLWPRVGPLEPLTTAEWWREVFLLHRLHHARCQSARRDVPVQAAGLLEAQNESRIWTPDQQLALFAFDQRHHSQGY